MSLRYEIPTDEIKKGRYNYLHCNGYHLCSQGVWTKELDIEKQATPLFRALRIKDGRLSEWIRESLKDEYKEEIAYRATTVQELDERERQLVRRLDTLYEDRLDGRISVELYNRKFKDYTAEQEAVIESRKRQANSNIKFYELGVTSYDVSQRAERIYLGAKTNEKKRELLSLVFDRVTLDGGTVGYEYSPPFKAVNATNRSKVAVNGEMPQMFLELTKDDAESKEGGSFDQSSLPWRRGRDSNSRCPYEHNAFPRRRTRPLCDLSSQVTVAVIAGVEQAV